MDNTEKRLIQVFQIIFPDLTAEQILTASQTTVADWDSMAAVNLRSTIEEEFSIEIEFDRLTSFQESLAYVNETLAATHSG